MYEYLIVLFLFVVVAAISVDFEPEDATQLLVEDSARKPGRAKQIADRFVKRERVSIMTGIIWSNIAIAVVPKVVARKVADKPIIKLFTVPNIHLLVHTVVIISSGSHIPNICLYHRIENASGSSLNISGVKPKKGDWLKDNGIIIKIGAIRKKNTIPQ